MSPFSEGLRFESSSEPRFELRFPESIELAVSANRIGYGRVDTASFRDVAHYVTDWALPLALMLRGTPALHGAAVKLPLGGACVICGLSGAGKSTLSLELSRRGHAKLADDIAAIRVSGHEIWVEPGVGHSKLLVDALDRMALPTDGLEPVMHKASKYIVPTVLWPSAEPLVCVIELVAEPGADVQLQPVLGPEKFSVLDRHTVGTTLMRRVGVRGMHLAWLQKLAGIPTYRMRRPLGTESLDQLIERLEQLWAEQMPMVG